MRRTSKEEEGVFKARRRRKVYSKLTQ